MPKSSQPGGESTPKRRSAIQYFGDYVLLGEIARGGMGVVYRALQTSLDREVALKMINAGSLASSAAIDRFDTEAKAMAKLDHPNIVSIYEISEHDGYHYFAMQLIDGESLAEHVQAPMPPRDAAQLMMTVAQAVHYAHERGVLHRDLKPSNILIDSAGEPHVTDFGIAKMLEREAPLTGSFATLGTPEYMSPEQAVGKTDQVTIAADIYSLGAVLYHALTGQPPFKGETPFQVLERVVNEQPVPPGSVNAQVDPELESICLRCLEKDPEARYSSAEAVAIALEDWLVRHDQASGAAPASPKRATSVAFVAYSIVVAIALGVTLGLWRPWERSTHAPKTSVITNDFSSREKIVVVTNTIPERTTNLVYVTTRPSGTLRTRRQATAEGEQTEFFNLSGRLERTEIKLRDGGSRTVWHDFLGKPRREETIFSDGAKQSIAISYARDGQERSREVLGFDAQRKLPGKSIISMNPGLLTNAVVTNFFDRVPFGFAYRPGKSAIAPAIASALIENSPGKFRYSWHWETNQWWLRSRTYFAAEDEYPSRAHWLVDWIIAGYLKDDYAGGADAAQYWKEARHAREELDFAKTVAASSKDAAELSEARNAQAQALARLNTAEEKAARLAAEAERAKSAKAHLSGSPIGIRVKSQLAAQLTRVLRQGASGDVAKTIAGSNDLFLVSRNVSVIAASDSSPAGVLVPGDVLRLIAGQKLEADANEHTLVRAVVATSRGGTNETPGGAVILIALRELQEFDSELRARLDAGAQQLAKLLPDAVLPARASAK
jgi:serine/threonine protein kinase